MHPLIISQLVKSACAELRMEEGREITPEEERAILLRILSGRAALEEEVEK